jgi:hypothetical protein
MERIAVNSIGSTNFMPLLWAEKAKPHKTVAAIMATEPHNFFIDQSPLLFVAKNNVLNSFLQVKS